MSTFDNPFDPSRSLNSTGCPCGRHVNQMVHDREVGAQLQCAPIESEENRYRSVVASAVMRAIFPKDVGRRAFLQSLGASTALVALAQFLPLAITMGVGSKSIPYTMPAVENINGQAITLAIKHKDKRDPKDWKGMKFAVPFDYSMHNYLLRYYVAEHGIDPDQDIQIRAVPPPEMVANLRADNIDGFLAPDPMNQRAVYDGVGFIHMLSKEIWDRHPCCAFAASKEFVTESPNTYAALLKAIIDATAFAHKPENRKQIAEAIAPANYLNQPVTVVEQVLTGTFADGLGNVKNVPDRIDFDPFPWQSFAVWIMTQMKRWGQIKGDVDYAQVAQEVFLAT